MVWHYATTFVFADWWLPAASCAIAQDSRPDQAGLSGRPRRCNRRASRSDHLAVVGNTRPWVSIEPVGISQVFVEGTIATDA